ncbi:MAG: pilus assembly protein [Desulfobacteraceae bacterium]|jgi:hypothetical protein
MKLLSIHKNVNGQAMTEFVIVFPALFLLFLVIIQTTLLMTAKQMVEYSAFCAARSAIVFDGNDKKIKRAADIACISISPKMTFDVMEEFYNYAVGLGEAVIDTADLIDEYPALAGLVFTWDTIPGGEIIAKLRNIKLDDIFNIQNVKLAGGLVMIDALCGAQGRVPLRYPTATLLTSQNVSKSGRDVSVEITHNYAMRVPIVNKLFFYGYIYGNLRNEIQDRLSNLPQGAVDAITSNALGGISSLADASSSGSLYLIPIKANCTLTIENEARTMENCD